MILTENLWEFVCFTVFALKPSRTIISKYTNPEAYLVLNKQSFVTLSNTSLQLICSGMLQGRYGIIAHLWNSNILIQDGHQSLQEAKDYFKWLNQAVPVYMRLTLMNFSIIPTHMPYWESDPIQPTMSV